VAQYIKPLEDTVYQAAIEDWDRVYGALCTLQEDMPKGDKRQLIGYLCHDGNGYWLRAKVDPGPPFHAHHSLYVMWMMGKYILDEI